jgi:hypothetical protein
MYIMNISVLIFIELIFIMLIGLIVYVSKKQKNFFLSYNLNLVILIVSVCKLFWFLWAFQNNYENTCQLSKKMHC